MDRHCYFRKCDNIASTTCRICALPTCKEHQAPSVVGPVCTRCSLRLSEASQLGQALSPTPRMGTESVLLYDPSTSAREILRDLARMLNTYGKRSVENACLTADALFTADEARDPTLRSGRTSTEKTLIRQLCQAISMMAEPGYIFTENPDMPHYFGFVQGDF